MALSKYCCSHTIQCTRLAYFIVAILVLGQLTMMYHVIIKRHATDGINNINNRPLTKNYSAYTIDESTDSVTNTSSDLVDEKWQSDKVKVSFLAPLIASPLPCQSSNYILLVINSKVEHAGRRDAIRQSWGDAQNINKYNQKNKIKTAPRLKWRLLFIVGQSKLADINNKAQHEAKQYHDLIIGNFSDPMKSLTLKTVLAMQWAQHFCAPKVFYKGDDDVFVNPYLLYDVAEDYVRQKVKKQWICRAHIHPISRRPVRNKKHRYYVPFNKYRDKLFPYFCSGFAYIMTGDALSGMVSVVNTTPIIDSVDDAFVGILAHKVKIVPKHDKRFKVYDRFDRRPNRLNRPSTELQLMRTTLAEHGIYYLKMKTYMANTNKAMLN